MQADIGLGFLIAVFVSHFFHFEPSMLFIVFCVCAALLPDIDFIAELLIHKDIAGKEIRVHREMLHYPITYIPLIILAYLIVGPQWGIALGLGILTHFLHDSIGIGFGIAWIWPFSKRNYKFFAAPNGYISWNLLQSWAHSDLGKLARDWGIDDWVTKVYIKPFPIRVPMWLLWFNAAEWVVFIIGSVSLWIYLIPQ